MAGPFDPGTGGYSPAGGVLTDLYTCPDNRAVLISIMICNTGAATTFRISLARKGAADDVSQYLFYDVAIGAAESVFLQNVSLDENDVVRGESASGDVSFNVMVDEIKDIVAI